MLMLQQLVADAKDTELLELHISEVLGFRV